MEQNSGAPKGARSLRRKPVWVRKLLEALENVTGDLVKVSHAGRLKSSRYFVWEDTDRNDWRGDNRHGEITVSGVLDLYTDVEFDEWVDAVGPALDAAEIAWEYTGTSWEPNTGLWHHSWAWNL